MNIRDIIVDKRFEIELNKMGSCYMNSLIYESFIEDDLYFTTEGIGEKLSDMKNRAITTIKKLWKKVKEWILKVIKNIKIMITPGKKLLSEHKEEIIKAYKQYGNKITVNAPQYDVDRMKHGTFTILVLREISKLGSYIDNCIEGSIDFDPKECTVKIGNEYIVDEHAKINEDVIKEISYECVYAEKTVKPRKLSEAISAESFIETLDGEKLYDEMKKSQKGCDESFGDMIAVFDPDKSEDDNERELLEHAVKFTTAYTKAAMINMNCFLPEYKKVFRFVMAASKKLLKYDNKNDNDGKNSPDVIDND